MTRRRAVDVGIRKAWSPTEAAGLIGVPYETVLDLIYDGTLAATKVGRYWVIPDAELDRLTELAFAEAEARRRSA